MQSKAFKIAGVQLLLLSQLVLAAVARSGVEAATSQLQVILSLPDHVQSDLMACIEAVNGAVDESETKGEGDAGSAESASSQHPPQTFTPPRPGSASASASGTGRQSAEPESGPPGTASRRALQQELHAAQIELVRLRILMLAATVLQIDY
jgi:hypothetical protein